MTPLEQYPNAPDLFHAYRHWISFPSVRRQPGGWEFEDAFIRTIFLLGRVVRHPPHRLAILHRQRLDIGAGLWPLPAPSPIDLERGPGAGRMPWGISAASQDFVFSSHCLEHIVAWEESAGRLDRQTQGRRPAFPLSPSSHLRHLAPGSPFVGTAISGRRRRRASNPR